MSLIALGFLLVLWLTGALAAMTTAAGGALLDLLFKNTGWANIGDVTGLPGSATAGNFYISLHTADPGVGGSQTTSETSYGSYARQPVARSGVGWSRTGLVLSPAAQINFPACTSGTATITYAGIGTASSGAGNLLCSGPVTPNISVATGVTPQLPTSSTFTVV